MSVKNREKAAFMSQMAKLLSEGVITKDQYNAMRKMSHDKFKAFVEEMTMLTLLKKGDKPADTSKLIEKYSK